MPKKAPKIPACRDPLDVPFLELAVGKADYLVTGEGLLSLARSFACPIAAVEGFLELLAKQ